MSFWINHCVQYSREIFIYEYRFSKLLLDKYFQIISCHSLVLDYCIFFRTNRAYSKISLPHFYPVSRWRLFWYIFFFLSLIYDVPHCSSTAPFFCTSMLNHIINWSGVYSDSSISSPAGVYLYQHTTHWTFPIHQPSTQCDRQLTIFGGQEVHLWFAVRPL